mgnify:FL=1
MDLGLIEGFVNKNVLIPGAEMTIERPLIGMGGTTQGRTKETVSLAYIRRKNSDVEFFCNSTVDGRQIHVVPNQIITIDGMEPNKLASVYGLKKDGSFKETGKKRGRKPKILQIT